MLITRVLEAVPIHFVENLVILLASDSFNLLQLDNGLEVDLWV